MSELKEQILKEIEQIINSAEGQEEIKIELIGHKNNVTLSEIDNFITQEVLKAVRFYVRKGKINSSQTKEITECAIKSLKNECVTSEYKIKQIVKDYIIHILARDLNKALKELGNENNITKGEDQQKA